MYFFESIMYPFKSERLVGKLLTALLLSIIPIVNLLGSFILMGYGLKIMANVFEGDPNLPEFDLGGDLGRGFMAFLGIIIYAIIPMIVFGLLAGMTYNPITETINPLVVLLAMFFSFAISPIVLVATARYAISGEFGEFLNVGDNISTAFSNIGAIVMFYVNAIAFGIVVGIGVMFGFMLLVIPGLILAVASQFASYHLYARFAQKLGIGVRKSKPKNDEIYDFA